MSKLRRTDHGQVTISDPGSDRPFLQLSTMQCCHCGGHFQAQPGSGKVRGWCMNCSGFVCGPGCDKCIPTEVLLESIEKGIPPEQVRRFVPAS